MVLELTKTEISRLDRHFEIANHRSNAMSSKCSPDRESTILKAVQEHRSNECIKRTYRTSDQTINRIKRKYGLWGV